MGFRIGRWSRVLTRAAEALPVALTIIVGTVFPGCDSESFLPPPPVADSAEDSKEKKLISVEFVLTRDDDPTHLLWSQVARSEAGNLGLMFNVSSPQPGEPASRQAELIRKAVANGVSALIVEPANAPEVVEALESAREKGIAVVLIDKPLPESASEAARAAFPLVTHPGFDETARAIADALVSDAKRLKFSPKGPAVILMNLQSDRYAQRRVAALETALRAAGVDVLPVIKFDGVPDEAKAAVLAAIKKRPEICMVAAENDQGVSGAAGILFDSKSHTFLLAGYVGYDSNAALGGMGVCSATVELNERGLARTALSTALKILRGEKVASRLEIRMPVRRVKATAQNRPPSTIPLDSQGANIIDNILKKARPQQGAEKQPR